MKTAVIVPTFNERDSAAALLQRLDSALDGYDAQIVFVDDGSDDLPEVVDEVRPTLTLPVRVIRRPVPTGRLGGAVLDGIRSTDSDLIVVCDGDLQHPPELIPEMIDQAAAADLVVASRYCRGGDAGGLSGTTRRVVSRMTGTLSRIMFPNRLRGCSDPMSGFFAVRRAALDPAVLRPRGFKILLELIARSRPMRVVEVPMTFGARFAGESHASATEGLRFVRQLFASRIAMSPTAKRAVLFSLVGLSGVLPNIAVLAAMTSAGLPYVPAALIAVQASIVWNFFGAELLVWRRFRSRGDGRRRFVTFLAVGETDLLRVPFAAALIAYAGMDSIGATLLTIAAASLLRFLLADRFVYRSLRVTNVDAALASRRPSRQAVPEAAAAGQSA